MDKVKVTRTELLEIIKQNREKHAKIVKEAKEAYRLAAIDAFEKELEVAKAGKPFRNYLDELTPPSDHTKDYDRVIKMLEMSKD